MRTKLVSVESCSKDRKYSILTVERIPGRVAKFFGAKPHTEQYRGNWLIWRKLPNMERAFSLESTLQELHDRHKAKNEFDPG